MSFGTHACVIGGSEGRCYRESDEVQPDERIRGYRLSDLLEPYFGSYEGRLFWETGMETRYVLDIPHERDAPYQVSNVYQCEPRNLYYSSPANVATDDGAFDNEIGVNIGRSFPDALSGAVRRSVASFSALADWQWLDGIHDHLGIDVSRYESSSLHFELDWSEQEDGPTGGTLTLHGALVANPELYDKIRVATVLFRAATVP